jgi:hypothetical protein
MKWRCVESGHWMAEADGWEWHAWARSGGWWELIDQRGVIAYCWSLGNAKATARRIMAEAG